MRIFLAALLALPMLAGQAAADTYRTCPAATTEQGRSIVSAACGALSAPDFTAASFTSPLDLDAARGERDAFLARVDAYAACVSDFIDRSRQPGMSADSLTPDQAACAHSWAEDQATEAVRTFGRACIDYANRSVMDARLTPWTGACYPSPDIN
jgi:hypothetical protein